MKNSYALAFLFLSLLTFVAVFYIYRANDHQECTSRITKTVNAQGQEVTTREHFCKEKFAI